MSRLDDKITVWFEETVLHVSYHFTIGAAKSVYCYTGGNLTPHLTPPLSVPFP